MRIGTRLLLLVFLLSFSLQGQELSTRTWKGTLRHAGGAPIKGAEVHLIGGHGEMVAETQADGSFQFANPPAGNYQITVVIDGVGHNYTKPLALQADLPSATVTLDNQATVAVTFANEAVIPVATKSGGEQLSSQTVSAIPLNKRDFSQLLLLAAGTMTDANGATNFTQQFAINGQRGVEATFAMDGADTSDPEMGGATFSNFNVDAVEGIQSSSGWMPAEIGHGAAGFTNIMTRTGKIGFHGSVFEFLRNSISDARNFFDHPTLAYPGRIPPFRRNEFGFTNGGPVVLPHVYDGRDRTFYFVQYQGFRQALGTTQVLAMPPAAERRGQDVVKYPDGSTDTLHVPVNPAIKTVLARYPLPNNPTGAYGARTYAAPSNVNT